MYQKTMIHRYEFSKLWSMNHPSPMENMRKLSCKLPKTADLIFHLVSEHFFLKTKIAREDQTYLDASSTPETDNAQRLGSNSYRILWYLVCSLFSTIMKH